MIVHLHFSIPGKRNNSKMAKSRHKVNLLNLDVGIFFLIFAYKYVVVARQPHEVSKRKKPSSSKKGLSGINTAKSPLRRRPTSTFNVVLPGKRTYRSSTSRFQQLKHHAAIENNVKPLPKAPPAELPALQSKVHFSESSSLGYPSFRSRWFRFR